MINDNERSKIAAKLRALADGKKPTAECSVDELYIALGLPFSCHSLEYAAIGYLADLIDRPTCRLDLTDTEVYGNAKVRTYECSECGRSCEEIYGKYERCPHCGRIVAEDD